MIIIIIINMTGSTSEFHNYHDSAIILAAERLDGRYTHVKYTTVFLFQLSHSGFLLSGLLRISLHVHVHHRWKLSVKQSLLCVVCRVCCLEMVMYWGLLHRSLMLSLPPKHQTAV